MHVDDSLRDLEELAATYELAKELGNSMPGEPNTQACGWLEHLVVLSQEDLYLYSASKTINTPSFKSDYDLVIKLLKGLGTSPSQARAKDLFFSTCEVIQRLNEKYTHTKQIKKREIMEYQAKVLRGVLDFALGKYIEYKG